MNKQRKSKPKTSLRTKLKNIKLLLLDVDGVLTDGRIVYTSDGVEQKFFDAHDGYGFTLALRHGLKLGIISGRSSPMVTKRASEFMIDEVHQDVPNKIEVYDSIKKKYHLKDSEIAYIGDDLMDVPVLQQVGFSAAPSDAIEDIFKQVDYVCSKGGGRGAVREVIDMILKAKSVEQRV
ncbi:MAG: HAD hydrolase family protein [Ignavibacteriales bacterium]|nr:HAD hydrolase family protein [Ignavibacteriales bacterium]